MKILVKVQLPPIFTEVEMDDEGTGDISHAINVAKERTADQLGNIDSWWKLQNVINYSVHAIDNQILGNIGGNLFITFR